MSYSIWSLQHPSGDLTKNAKNVITFCKKKKKNAATIYFYSLYDQMKNK